MFLYEKSSTRKVTSDFNGGNPVKHFQNPQKPNRKKVTGLLRSRGKKIQKNFKLTSGAPFARSATSSRKKLVSNFFGKNVQNMIRNMNGSLKYFFKISSHSRI